MAALIFLPLCFFSLPSSSFVQLHETGRQEISWDRNPLGMVSNAFPYILGGFGGVEGVGGEGVWTWPSLGAPLAWKPTRNCHMAVSHLFQWPRMGPTFKGLMQHPTVPSCWSPTLSNRPWGPNMALKGPWGPQNSLL